MNQTAPNGQLVLADASDPDHAEVGGHCAGISGKESTHRIQKDRKIKALPPIPTPLPPWPKGITWRWQTTTTSWPHAMYTMGKAILQLRQQGLADDFCTATKLCLKRASAAPGRPTLAGLCPGLPAVLQLHLSSGGVPPQFVSGAGRRAARVRRQPGPYDLFLRLAQRTGGAVYVPQVLYYWRVHAGSTSGGADAKPYVANGAKSPGRSPGLHRRRGTVEDGLYPSTYRVKWEIQGSPKVSILIPNKDHTAELEQCLHSLWTKTQWDHFQVIVIENNSTDPETFAYYKKAQNRYDGLQVVQWPGQGFNFSAINNYGRQFADGEYLLLLNNDVEVINGDWLTELLRQCARPDGAAAAGAMLYYPDDTIQHAGVITGLGAMQATAISISAGAAGLYVPCRHGAGSVRCDRACLLVRADVWDELGGLDEAFAVAFNDVDFCLRGAGQRRADHLDTLCAALSSRSKSRGDDEKDPVKAARFAAEQQRLYALHGGKQGLLADPTITRT